MAATALVHGKCSRDTLRAATGLNTGAIRWVTAHNRGYCDPACPRRDTGPEHTYWEDKIANGYKCPSGWYRHSIAVPSSIFGLWLSISLPLSPLLSLSLEPGHPGVVVV